jgi:DNA-binding transcriptional ArsR family regulator
MRATERLSTRLDTSDAAFAAAPKGAAGTILAALRERPRCVDELMHDLEMSHSTCSSAVNRLMRAGFVEDVGIRAMTRNGRSAAVWLPTQRPVPIADDRPTRAMLEERINKAISAIDFKFPPAVIARILRGEP